MVAKGHNYGICRKCDKNHIHSRPQLGKKHTEKEKRKIRDSVIKSITPEHRIKRREVMNRLWKEGKVNGWKLDKNPNWKGGVSFEPYSTDFTNILKNKIRQRDNNCCIMCGLTSIESIYIYNRDLTVHHLDFDKKNNEKSNLLTLCNSCHSKITTKYYNRRKKRLT